MEFVFSFGKDHSSLRLPRLYFIIRALGIFASFLICLLSLMTIIPSDNNENVEAASGVYSEPSLTITPSDTATMTVTPGTLKSVTQTIGVTTTNYSGYTLSFVADGTSSNLVNSSDSNATIPSISQNVTSSNFTNNRYGYSKDGGTNYLAIPVSTSVQLATTNKANSTANNYTLTFGAKVDSSIASGSYTKTFIITAVANPSVTYSMTYNKNTTDTVTSMPGNVSATTTGSPSLSFKTSTTTPSRTNYDFLGWAKSSSATTPDCTAGGNCSFTLDPDTANSLNLYAVWRLHAYTITLNGNGATTAGSTSTTVTYGATNLAAITVPQRKYTISGFTTTNNNASGATVSSTSTLTSTYTFNGWYKESGATNKIASNAAIPALMASTSYTNANAEWTSTSNQILYAGWSSQEKTLPTITKTGYTCGWTETSTGATSITWASGAKLTPAKNYTLYGVCTAIDYTITVNAGAGISSLALSGWTGTGTGTLTKIYHIGDTIDLSTFTRTYKTGYSGVTYTKNDSVGTLSNYTYTVGAGNGNITIKAAALDTPVCTMQGGTTKVYNYQATTLTATSNAASYDTDSVDITYSFGYATSATAALGNFGTAQTGNTISIAKNAYTY